MIVKAGPLDVRMQDDDRICAHVRERGGFEPDTLAAWVEMCKPGTEVLDVGAYSGLFSIAAAMVGARPVAIEPMPGLVARIRENAAMNGVNFMTIRAAATDQDGRARLGFNERVHMTAGASLGRKSGGHLDVQTVRLDSLKVENVSAVKIDVERHELAVLAGARRLLAVNKPRLIIEVLDKAARKAVEQALRRYRTIDFLDKRNLIMEPR